eukprot:GFUD01025772.1.p1 GENE.GFUD01025772.1~~GFUD01025772.1.p1  ORF type:complete len:394 (+),score=66.89 GFUD01025772.1:129-1310(+)
MLGSVMIMVVCILPTMKASVLYCYVCKDCPEKDLEPLHYTAACPDDSHVSCIATVTTFAEYKTISRGCSRAPAVARRGRYNKENGAICSQHTVNMMRATVCLCDTDTCNGPGLPPREMIEAAHVTIGLVKVDREMNAETKELQPEPMSIPVPDLEPYFDLGGIKSQRNISAVEGKTAKLSCTVQNLGDRRVSWIRRATHPIVLSSGAVTFTSDSRVSVNNLPGTKDWVLNIDMVRTSDRGYYECQVNTDPKIVLKFRLNLLTYAAVIHGKSTLFVKPGSTISLTCSIQSFSSPPTSIQWFRDTRALNLDSAQGGISLENEKTPQGTRSTLIVTKATGDDTGNYTCSPSSGHAASVMVHVVDGEIQGARLSTSGCFNERKIPNILLLCLWLFAL